MAQLSIPQSLIGTLIDIAALGTLDYFPPTERCAHWSLYDAHRQELLCPCAPAANTTAEKLFEAAAKILYENFPRYIDSPEEIIPYTSRQELIAALRRGDEKTSDSKPLKEEQNDLQATETTADSTAEAPVAEANEGAVSEDAVVSAAATPKPAAPKPAAPTSAAPKPAVPTPGAPSPGMFRKSTLTYRPARIEDYLEGLRARQQPAEAAEPTHTEASSDARTQPAPTECARRPGYACPEAEPAEARSPDPHGYGSHQRARHSAGNH